MNFAALDLNLLRVFDAMMIELNTTRAGERVGLSQPAVSSALGRLRHITGDELFVREGNRMVPTQRARCCASRSARRCAGWRKRCRRSRASIRQGEPDLPDQRLRLFLDAADAAPCRRSHARGARRDAADARPSDRRVMRLLGEGAIDLACRRGASTCPNGCAGAQAVPVVHRRGRAEASPDAGRRRCGRATASRPSVFCAIPQV